MAAKTVRKKKPSELDELRARAAKALGTSEKEAELRALRELLASLPAAPEKKPAPQAAPGNPLPQRLYLMLDGRGLDGRGMPVEVIDLPCVIGSGRNCNVWIKLAADRDAPSADHAWRRGLAAGGPRQRARDLLRGPQDHQARARAR